MKTLSNKYEYGNASSTRTQNKNSLHLVEGQRGFKEKHTTTTNTNTSCNLTHLSQSITKGARGCNRSGSADWGRERGGGGSGAMVTQYTSHTTSTRTGYHRMSYD